MVVFGLPKWDAKAETPVFWPPHAKSWFIGKDSDAGRDWGQEKKRMTEDEMAGWHHRLDGREFEWTPELVMDREAWRAMISGVTKSRTRLSDWTELNWSGSVVKNSPAKQEIWVRSLNWEDPLEKEIATHSHILAWEIPWTEDSGRLHSVHGVAKSYIQFGE